MFEEGRKIEQQERPGEARIGILPDLHKATSPLNLIEQAVEADFDTLLINGDLTSSDVVQGLIDEFKKANDKGETPALSENELDLFNELKEQGFPPIRAYIKAKFKHNPELWEEEMSNVEEIARRYGETLRDADKPIFLPGNLESSYPAKLAKITEIFDEFGIEVAKEPRVEEIDQNEYILYWPSVDPQASPELIKAFEDKVPALVEQLRNAEKVMILAHEQLFHGPPPETYLENVREEGLEATAVPRYMPNPTRRELLDIIKELKEDTKLVYVNGHIHDEQEVVQAGMPFEKSENGGMAWQFRTKEKVQNIEMFQAPADKVSELKTSKDSISFTSINHEESSTN